MEKSERVYAVKELAKMAGVSVRTLHHYDHLGLLKPSSRTAAGYRLYGQKDLLRLQQILFYRELDFPLSEIKKILDRPGFRLTKALESHRTMLQERAERLARLLKTIDKTIQKLQEENVGMTDEELYEGFSKEQIEGYRREVSERYDPKIVAESEQRVRKMSKEQWKAIKQAGDEIPRRLAGLMDRQPGDGEVQKAIALHYQWIGNFYTASAEIYRGLGTLYTQDPRFRANYDKHRAGLADFMKAAMEYYCDHTLTKQAHTSNS
jgi:DNA-binding transcriptional MerR regulator